MNEKTTKPNIRIIIRIVVIAAVIIVFYLGTREPAVTVDGGSIKIGGLFGATVPLSEVRSVTLLDESMTELGAGARTSGFGGIGDTLRGRFDLNGDKRLLYVKSNSAPTIYIDCAEERDVYISYRDAEETVRVYEQLKDACGG